MWDPNKDDLWLSHSRLEIARKCMQNFAYKYIYQYEPESVDESASNFGNLIHEIAEKYNGSGKQELLALFHEISPKYIISNDYKPKISLALKNIHSYFKAKIKDPSIVKREEPVKLRFNEKIMVSGKIDLMIPNDDRFIVTDYKTKKSYKWSKPTDQLAMYGYFLNTAFKIPLNKIDYEMVYLSLDSSDKYGEILVEGVQNIVKSYKITQNDVDYIKREIEVLYNKIIKSIETQQWSANPTKFNCTYCEYKERCPKSFLKNSEEY